MFIRRNEWHTDSWLAAAILCLHGRIVWTLRQLRWTRGALWGCFRLMDYWPFSWAVRRDKKAMTHSVWNPKYAAGHFWCTSIHPEDYLSEPLKGVE